MRKAFLKKWKLYLMEALGLGIFMISSCFFAGLFESDGSSVHQKISDPFVRLVLMGIMMGLTALFIFYSPATSPSGSHINPAVTITFLRLGRIGGWDAFFYIIFQLAGGTLAVFLMAVLMNDMLTAPPVNSVVTVPLQGSLNAAVTEFSVAFIMMTVILFTSYINKLSRYTKIIAACLVCCFVVLAGPVSGFGMNPARTIASALPSDIWTDWWIYIFIPIGGMLTAAEVYLSVTNENGLIHSKFIGGRVNN
ncbi:MAG TPA: aquaporin [Chitinophagaceae bacterium]